MIKINYKTKKGFTLIEMLIVIAIISILSSVFLVGLRGFRAGAYDARRLADIQKVQSYLEIYYTSKRVYPSGISNWGDNSCGGSSLCSALKTIAKVPGIPNDPIAAQSYKYCVDSSNNQSYIISATLSTADHSVFNEPSTYKGDLTGYTCTSDSGAPVDCSAPNFCIKF
ncbi:type II secretion system protein [Candidatus Wolfebacteria bacterium]|nr:type II secretion system protein [Candidatus Wolfebacteria bacterium]